MKENQTMKHIIILLTLLCVTAACSGEKYGAGADKAAPTVTVKDVYLDRSLQEQSGDPRGHHHRPVWVARQVLVLHAGRHRPHLRQPEARKSFPARRHGEEGAGHRHDPGRTRKGYQIVAQGVEVR